MENNNSKFNLNDKIDEINQNLIDLSDDNTFLNFKWDDLAVPIIDVDFFVLFDKLVLKRQEYEFKPESDLDQLKDILSKIDSKERIEKKKINANIKRVEKFANSKNKLEYYSQNTLSLIKIPEFYIDRSNEFILQTPLNNEELISTLQKIDYAYQKSIKTVGIANLFLALAYLEYENSQIPLIFIPVNIKKSEKSYKLFYNDYDEIKVNPYLEILLKEKDIQLENKFIQTEMDMITYLADLKNKLTGIGELRSLVTLSSFDFSNIILANDLVLSNWSGDAKDELNSFLSDSINDSKDSLINEDDVGSIDENEICYVSDLDSSQLAVIGESKLSDVLLVDSLSKNNKSETIINLIADIIANKQTVLYVSDKIEAISDIESRLNDLSLRFSYLDLYGDSYDNSKFVDELISTINYNLNDFNFDSKYYNIKIEEYGSLKSKLNNYFSFIHNPYAKTDYTPYQLIGIKEDNLNKIIRSNQDLKIIPMKNISKLDKNELDKIFSEMDVITKIYKDKIAPVSKFPLNHINTSSIAENQFLNILNIIPDLKESLKNLLELNKKMFNNYGIKKLEKLSDFDSHFEKIKILDNHPHIMGDDYQTLMSYIDALNKYQMKRKEYGTIEEFETILTNELDQTKEELKYYMDELNKLNKNIDDLKETFLSFNKKLDEKGIKQFNSIDEISSSINSLKLLTKNPALIKEEKVLEDFIGDIETYQNMNSTNPPINLLKYINENSGSLLDHSLKRIDELISFKDSIQSIQDLINMLFDLKKEIGLNKTNNVKDLETSLENCDLLLENPVLIDEDDDLNKFYLEYKSGYEKFSKNSFDYHYNIMNKDFNKLQDDISNELTKTNLLESNLLSLKEEFKILKEDLDDLSDKISVKSVNTLKDVDKFLDDLKLLFKGFKPFTIKEKDQIDGYIQILADKINGREYTNYSQKKIDLIVKNIIKIKNEKNRLKVKDTIFTEDIQRYEIDYKNAYYAYNKLGINIDESKRAKVKNTLNDFKKSKEGFLNRFKYNKGELKNELKSYYIGKPPMSESSLIKDYDKYFESVEIMKRNIDNISKYFISSDFNSINKNYESILSLFADLTDLKDKYDETKPLVAEIFPKKDLFDTYEDLLLIKIKLDALNSKQMDEILGKYFDSYRRFSTNLNDLYREYDELNKLSSLYNSGHFNENSKTKLGFLDKRKFKNHVEQIEHQKSKIIYYITLINNNLDLKGSFLSMDQIFSKDFDESMEYCDNLYNQIKDSNDLFDESLDNHELKDIDVVMENFNKFNSFNEIKFLVNTSDFEAPLNDLKTEYDSLLFFDKIYDNNKKLIDKYYMDIWEGKNTLPENIQKRNEICQSFTELIKIEFFNEDIYKFLSNPSNVLESKISDLKDLSKKLQDKIKSFDGELIYYTDDLSIMNLNNLKRHNEEIFENIDLLANYKSKLSSYDKDTLVDFNKEFELDSINKVNDLSVDLRKLFNDPSFDEYKISFDDESKDLNKINSSSDKFKEILSLEDSIISRDEIYNDHFFSENEDYNLWYGPLTPINTLIDKIEIDKEFTKLYKESLFSDKTIEIIKEDPKSYDELLYEITVESNKLISLIKDIANFNIIKNHLGDVEKIDFNVLKSEVYSIQNDLNEIDSSYSSIEIDKNEFNIGECSKNIEEFDNIIDSEFIQSTNHNLDSLEKHEISLKDNLKNLQELMSLKESFDNISIEGIYFDHLFEGYDTSVSDLNKQVNINKEYEKLHKDGFFNDKVIELVDNSRKFNNFKESCDKQKEYANEIISEVVKLDMLYENEESFINQDINKVSKSIDFLESHIDDLNSWRIFQVSCDKYDNRLSHDYINSLRNDEIDINILDETFKYNFAQNLLNEIKDEDLIIDLNDIGKYKSLNKEIINLNKSRIFNALNKNKPRFSKDIDNSGLNEQYIAYSLIYDELDNDNKSPIKNLLADTIEFIKLIKPIFIMNPMAVASYLDSERFESYFDYIIFDDVSNSSVEKSISSLLRGKKKIIFSNSKLNSEKGIFKLLKPKFKNRLLRWHYGSFDTSLTNLLNNSYYDGSLIIHPSAESEERYLELNYSSDSIFDEKLMVNKLEAKKIVMHILNHFKEFGIDKSLGIITFTKAQKELILELLEKEIEKNTDLSNLINHFDLFSLKSIDEVFEMRDINLISFTYGFDKNKKLNLDFSTENEYLFNLILSRAIEKTVLYTNFKLEDMDSNNSQIEILKDIFKFIENNVNGNNKNNLSLLSESVYEFLSDNGYTVKKQVKNDSKYPIDLVVMDNENPDDYLLAIECDGDNLKNFTVLKDREIIHKNLLAKLGWNYYHIYASEWYSSREKSQETLLNTIKKAIEYKDLYDIGVIFEDFDMVEESFTDVVIDEDDVVVVDDVIVDDVVIDEDDVVVVDDVIVDDVVIDDDEEIISDDEELEELEFRLEDKKISHGMKLYKEE